MIQYKEVIMKTLTQETSTTNTEIGLKKRVSSDKVIQTWISNSRFASKRANISKSILLLILECKSPICCQSEDMLHKNILQKDDFKN